MKSRRSRPFLEQLETRQLLSGYQPTATEQLMLEQLNDIRANPAAYGASIGVDLSQVAPAPPLAFDPRLIQAARDHAQDMNNRGYFDQVTPDGINPGQRLTNANFPWISYGESSAAGSNDPDTASALQDLITDANDPNLSHRSQLLALDALSATQTQVGIGIVQGGSGPLTNYYTIDTAATTDGQPFITGVVFNDQNGNGKYDIGEGLGGVLVTVSGAGANPITTSTWDSGGYSLQVGPGTYTVTISQGPLTAPVSQTVTVTTSNVRLNFAVPSTAVQTDTSAWISLLYRDLLDRVPSSSELSGWVQTAQGGASRATIANGFLHSAEYAQDLVSAWYQQFFHRAPDALGLSTFSSILENGGSEDAVRADLLVSQEYWADHGGTAQGFVQGLYQDLLGRTPGTDEATRWINTAATGARATVVEGMLQSAEFQTDEVQTFYDRFLRRNPDATGVQTFTGLLQQNTDERDIVQDLVTSDEYYASAQPIQWLQALYRDVLGRTGDNPTELGSWLANLDSGMDRTTLAKAFVSSPEALAREVGAVYQHLLGTSPDTATLNTLVNLLQADGRLSEVIAQIASSPDYYTKQGGTDNLYIRGLYRDLLGRVPSDTEVTFWLGKLDGASTREQVVNEFTDAPEYQQDFIANLYLTYLRRSPTTQELSQQVSLLQQGSQDADVKAALLGSDEYYQEAAG